MNIVDDYEIAVANLVVALSDNSVSDEQRALIRDSVGADVERIMEVVNVFIVDCLAKSASGKMTKDRMKKTIESEYKAIGFDKIMPYKYLKKPVELLSEKEKQNYEVDRLKKAKDMFETNKECPIERVKVGVTCLSLRVISHFGLVTEDIEFTRNLIKEIGKLTETEKNEALIPAALVMEL